MSEFMVQLIAQYPEIARAQELAGVLPPIVGSILETIESKGSFSANLHQNELWGDWLSGDIQIVSRYQCKMSGCEAVYE